MLVLQKQYLLAALALCAAPVANAQSLLTTLQAHGLSEFAKRLQGDLLLGNSSGIIVYAPSDAALTGNGTYGNLTITRRSGESNAYAAQNRYQISGQYALRYHRNKVRSVTNLGSVYGTLLDDPDWVNLGSGNNQTIVQKDGPAGSLPSFFTGLGKTVKVTGNDIPFDGGVIRPVDGLFTLPKSLSATLPFLGDSQFGSALQKSGLLAGLDNKTAITVLAPNDAAFKIPSGFSDAQVTQLLKSHIIVGETLYSPWLDDGSSHRTLGGTTVTISVQNDVLSVNGVQIVAGDAIIKNGVIHTINQTLPSSPASVPTNAASTSIHFSSTLLVLPVFSMALSIYYLLL